MRSAYETPPWLAPENTPAVSATSGLGTGGGAAVQTADSSGFGDVFIQVGSDPSTGGYVNIVFPSTPPTLFISGSEDLGTVSQNTVGNLVALSWNAKPRANSKQLIHYEWFDGNAAIP